MGELQISNTILEIENPNLYVESYTMESHFTKEWTATCPRCEQSTTHAEYSCKNCGKGTLKVLNACSRSELKRLGCSFCGDPGGLSVQCTKCGASITNNCIEIGGCFIATAVFGYDSYITRQLRIFRDEVLMKYSLGRSFVFWYYKNSVVLLRRIGYKIDQ